MHSYLDKDMEHRPAMVPHQAWASGLRAIQLPWDQAISHHTHRGRLAAGTECRREAILATLPLPMQPDRLAGQCRQVPFHKATILVAMAAVPAVHRR